MSEGREVYFMSSTIIGVVKDGVVVPWSPLPEGAQLKSVCWMRIRR
jgi:hypothetical protein